MLVLTQLLLPVSGYRHTYARGGSVVPKVFLRNATWEELTDHCEQEHPTACEEVAGMAPGDVMELRQRMMALASYGAAVGIRALP